MKKLMLLFVAIMSLALCASAQNRKISGTVVSAEDDEPLVGATVMPIGGGTGTATNIDGKFVLNVPPSVKELRISYVGMHEAKVPAEDGVEVKLINSTNKLDEIIVVAYGTAKKSEYTGSASVVGAQELEDAPITTATSALTGKVSGVQTFSSNGQPGVAPTVRIRGVGSINASSDPLYVVDGMPYEGEISLLSTSDIESMTVLKDAASTALYGARGANGVILVTTKRGKSDNVKVTVDARWGANSRMVSDYETIKDTDQYVKMLGMAEYNNQLYNLRKSPETALAAVNSKLSSGFGTGYQIYTLPSGENFFLNSNFDINPAAVLGYSDGEYYYTPDDWQKGTYHNGFRQEYNVSVQNATDRLNYYVSASYLTDSGLIKNSHFNRLSTRANVEYQLKPWLKLGTNLAYVYTNSAYPDDQTTTNSSGNAFLMANMIGPVYPFYARNANGTVKYDAATGNPVYDYGDKTYGTTNFTRNYMNGAQPIGALTYDISDYLCDFFQGKWFATVTPLAGLVFNGTIGYTVDNTRYHGLGNDRYGQSSTYGGQISQEQSRYRTIDLQGLVSYSRTFNNVHFMDIMFGYESMDYATENVWGNGTCLYLPDVPYLGNIIDNKNTGGGMREYDTRGILLRGNYNFDTRYYFMASFRRDASSRFAKDKRWGNFWSVSGAWDIAKEKFMRSATGVDMLKFKISFGQNGNDNIGYTLAYADLYSISGGDGIWNDATLTQKGNPDLTWEKSNSFNVGFDFSFLNGKIDGTIEYYNRQTDDMLYFKPTAPSLGYSSIPMNIGSMRNYGAELDLNVNVFNNRDFSWDLNGNLTLGWNKVLKLHPDLNGEWKTGGRIFREGESMYQLYLLKYAGVNPTTGEALYWDKDANGNEFVTTDASSAYNNNRQSTGNIMPLGYGGFGTTLKFYGFDFGISFAYQFGGKILDYTYHDLMYGGNSSYTGQAMHKDLLNAWTPGNVNTNVPRLNTNDSYTTGSSGTNYYCDRWLTSSNYLQLTSITLGYTFKPAWIRCMGLSELRVYGSAENVALWAARKGLDPRQGFVSSNNATYGASRVITGGLRVSF